MTDKDDGKRILFSAKGLFILGICIIIAWKFDTIYAFATGGGTVIPEEDKIFYGNLNIKLNEVDSSTGESETPSNAVYVAYHSYGFGLGAGGAAVSASGTTFEVTKEDNGLIYLRVFAGDNHFVDDVEVASASRNPRVDQAFWQDVTGDNKDDLILKIDVSDISDPMPVTAAPCTLQLPLMDEDIALTLDSPADITSIGTTEVPKTITWTLSDMAEKAGLPIVRIYVVTNSSRSGEDVRMEKMTLSGMSVSRTFNGPAQEETGDYVAWYFVPADYAEIANGIMVYRGPNETDELRIALTVRCTLNTGDYISVAIYIDTVDSGGNLLDAITDTVVLVA